MPRVKTEAKERAILDAAAKVFAMKPFHGVLIDEIASDAGIGKGTIYRYFETKDELYFATTLHILDQLADALSESLVLEKSATKRLERIAQECLRFYWERRFLFPYLESDGMPGRREELGQLVAALVELPVRQRLAAAGHDEREVVGALGRVLSGPHVGQAPVTSSGASRGQGRAASKAAATASARASWWRRATICMPTGAPSTSPMGTDTTGLPFQTKRA